MSTTWSEYLEALGMTMLEAEIGSVQGEMASDAIEGEMNAAWATVLGYEKEYPDARRRALEELRSPRIEEGGKIPQVCPHCGAGRESFVADYYEAVYQGIYVTDEETGAYDYDGVYGRYDDGSTGDECIRCRSCFEEVVVFGKFTLVPTDTEGGIAP